MFLTRGNSQYAILNSIVYIPGCPVTISGSLSYHRIAYVENLKGRMNSRSAALAALAAASALLAYIVFRKREPTKAKEVEEVTKVEQEFVKEKVEPQEAVTSGEEPEKGLEEECFVTDKERRGKESLMEWIDRQLEEAERKTGGSPWPEIPQEENLMIGGGEEYGDGSAAVDSDQSLDNPEVGRELSNVKRDIKEVEEQLLGAELQLQEAEKCVSSQGGKYVLTGEMKRVTDEREGTQAADTLLTDNSKHSLGLVLEGSINPEQAESNHNNLKAGKEEKSINESSSRDSPHSCNIDDDMSSDSEIELLKESSRAGEDNETGQLLDETESEGENTENVTLDVSPKKEHAKKGSDTVADNPDELIALRPAWQKNLPSKN